MSPEEIRARVAAVPLEARCCDGCRTYVITANATIEICDECWSSVPDALTDDDVATLPEALAFLEDVVTARYAWLEEKGLLSGSCSIG